MLSGCEGVRGCVLSGLGAGRYLFSTRLSGTLPESVGEMSALVQLDAHSTLLSGVGNISQSRSL
eukprot:COSAG03_NODE_10110_length_671_cov_3.786713_1_plen_63_part_01